MIDDLQYGGGAHVLSVALYNILEPHRVDFWFHSLVRQIWTILWKHKRLDL